MEKVLWVSADILTRQSVGAASTKAAVTVGVNAPLTSGSENSTADASWNVRSEKTEKGMLATEKERVLKGRRQASVMLTAGNIVIKN